MLGRPGELDWLLVLRPGLHLPGGWEYWVGRLLGCQGLGLSRGPGRGPGAGSGREARVGGPRSPFAVECSPQDDRCQLEVLHAAGAWLVFVSARAVLSEGFGQGNYQCIRQSCVVGSVLCIGIEQKEADVHTLRLCLCISRRRCAAGKRLCRALSPEAACMQE